MTLHLWDFKHPYYATEGNYYSNDCHIDYETWQEFIDEQGDADLDMNLLYRWDWEVPDPDDYEPEEEMPGETVALFFMGQRKALARSARVSVTRDQEDEIRAWLTVRAAHMRLVWEPLL